MRAINAGDLRETASFDAKMSLPPPGRNKDLAKDICAMTVDGGVLLYGLGGEDPTRPDTLTPFDLAGTAERIDQVVQTGIGESPAIEIRDVESSADPARGFLVVVVPPSPRAPHMLILDGDNRYWGRGATGNRRLSEGEVARLYARRERWEVDRGALLEDAVDAMPFSVGDEAAICLFARPVASASDLVGPAAGSAGVDALLDDLRQVAASNDPYLGQGDLSISQATRHDRRGAHVWALDAGRLPDDTYAARLEVGRDGLLRYWSKPLAYERRGQFAVLERSVTRDAGQFAAVVGALYERGGYVGAVDLGVAVVGIETAAGASMINAFTPRLYGAPDYRQTDRITMQELTATHQAVVRALLAPLYDVISRAGYDPFNDAG